ncbi:MAG: hypothetical protein HGA62_05300 [Chlorobiaceae bacterium]|nr:hypothetical protein [Chlorobiaceae bacterium]NTV60548.1 hypothetical protein [Chlorobiaceae bacterium]
MKPNHMPAMLVIILAALMALTGCLDNGTPVLDNDDIRFAGFYSDYLQNSGVAPAEADEIPVVLASADIIALLAKHNLDRELLARKTASYRSDPNRWGLVLEQVRLHIRQKEAGGE